MREVIKYFASRTYKPLLTRYLSKKRVFRQNGFTLEIPAGVFHPGFFFSTRILLSFLKKLPLKGKSFLELGAGSGLISMHAVEAGAIVTASDINPIAIDFLEKNSISNGLEFSIIESDLFTQIPAQQFDIIAINPPYYKKNPVSNADHAWYCGENGEYFQRLFDQLGSYMHHSTEVFMILCDGCDLELIKKMAEQKKFNLELIHVKKTIIEKNFIMKIVRNQNGFN